MNRSALTLAAILTVLSAPQFTPAEPPPPAAQAARDAIKDAAPGPIAHLGWGRTYLAKDGTLYVQVNVWPNGEDLVLPIANDPAAVRFVTDKPADPPQSARKDDGLHLTDLPKTAPGGGKLPVVVALSFGETGPKVLDNSIKQSADGSLALLATACDVHATNAKLEKKGDRPYNIGYWTNVKDHVTWDATLTHAGTFDVSLEYSLGGSPGPAEIEIEFGQAGPVLPVKLTPGKDFLDFRTIPIGQVTLKEGPLRITLKPTKKPGVAVMDLRRIDLKPTK
jgi:hypothetical protein